MTVLDVARVLIRGRGTPTSTPEFIAAYLDHEMRQARQRAIAYMDRFLADTTKEDA